MLPYYVIHVFGDASIEAHGPGGRDDEFVRRPLSGIIVTYFCRYERIGKSHSGERQHEAPCVHTLKPWFVLQKYVGLKCDEQPNSFVIFTARLRAVERSDTYVLAISHKYF